jgi:DNA-directed RNA polymerase specialized sigma24 family protein
MNQQSEAAALGRVEPYIRRMHAPRVCRTFLALDDDDVQSECRIQALRAIRAFREKRQDPPPEEELKFARTAVRNRLISLVRQAGTNCRIASSDKAIGTVAVIFDEAHRDTPEDDYIEAERESRISGAIRSLLYEVGKSEYKQLQPRHLGAGLRRSQTSHIDALRARASRVLSQYALTHMKDEREGLMVPVNDLSVDDLARAALVNSLDVTSLDKDELVKLVTIANTDAATGQLVDFPTCFGIEYEAGDDTCDDTCDFGSECNAVKAGREGTADAEHGDVEAQLVQLKKAATIVEPDAVVDPPKSEEPEVVMTETGPEVEVAINADGEYEPIEDLNAAGDPNVDDGEKSVEAMSDAEFQESASTAVSATPAKEKARKKAKATRKPRQTTLNEQIEDAKMKKKPDANKYLKAHYKKESNDEMGKALSLSPNTIRRKLTELGLKRPPAKKAAAPKKKAAAQKTTTKKAKKKTTKPAVKAKAKAVKTKNATVKKKVAKKKPRGRATLAGDGVTLSGRSRKPEGGYATNEKGERYTRLPQGSAAELARLPVGTEVDRIWKGDRFYAKKLTNGPEGGARARDGVWALFKVAHIKTDGTEGAVKKPKKPFKGSLNQIARFITTTNNWSGAKFFSVLPPALDRSNTKYDPSRYKPDPVYTYAG